MGEDRAALVDTGYGMGDIKSLCEKLTDLSITVVTTHTHADHIGQNCEFDEVAVFNCPYSRENANQGRDHESLKRALEEGMIWKPLPQSFNPEKWHIPPFEVTRWLREGDSIDLGGRMLEVYHTPGHSPDSICLLDRDARLFWTGDIFYNAPIYLYGETTDLGDFIRSYRKMIELSPLYDRLLPGYNETYIEKGVLGRVLEASEGIRDGEGGKYREQIYNGIKIRRYDYEGFAIIVKA
ncbi:MAG: MBL fold metallo-hydrolase [Candidatus Bathyarchaeota archaeon]